MTDSNDANRKIIEFILICLNKFYNLLIENNTEEYQYVKISNLKIKSILIIS